MNSIDKAIDKLKDYKETLNSMCEAMAKTPEHYMYERWISVDNDTGFNSVMGAMTRAFKHLSNFYGLRLNYKINMDQPITWLDRGFKECLEEIQENINYLGEYFIEWILGTETEDEIRDYMEILYTDVYMFVSRYSRQKFFKCNEKESICKVSSEDNELYDDEYQNILNILMKY